MAGVKFGEMSQFQMNQMVNRSIREISDNADEYLSRPAFDSLENRIQRLQLSAMAYGPEPISKFRKFQEPELDMEIIRKRLAETVKPKSKVLLLCG